MSKLKVLFFADLVGKQGRYALAQECRNLREKYEADYVIANVENAAGGFGITPEMCSKVFSYGVDCQTSGNHIWDRLDIWRYINEQPKLLRPANFPPGTPGNGFFIDDTPKGRIGILNLMGRTYMKDIDCPFRVGEKLVDQMSRETDIIIIDFHAEVTSEKQALAYFLDGKVTAIIGTHTHVQTADETVSERGTAYITDVGMTGPHDSIIGMAKRPSLDRFLTGMPHRFASANNDIKICGVLLTIETDDGAAEKIERFKIDIGDYPQGKEYDKEN